MNYFDQSIQRVGFACKYMHPDQSLTKKLLEDVQRPFNGKTTTARWLASQSCIDIAEQRLYELAKFNCESVINLIKYVASLPPNQRMLRIGSDVLPMYTHPDWKYFYNNDVKHHVSSRLKQAGDLARDNDVRLSMHPGQFTVLASDNPDIVENSIREFEYHADIARMMGYGENFMDFKINVHISGRNGPDGIDAILPRLSTEARNCITIENDENAWGIDSSLDLANDLALVLDIHHHWCREGEYIQPTDDRFKRVIDSWRGVRPTIHYSLSREDILIDHPTDVMPDMPTLLEDGYKKHKLRAHSDMMWNTACNQWAESFLPYADIMIEAKHKNLASSALINT